MFAVAERLIFTVEVDGLPYLAVDWLERRIYRDEVRTKRWLQEARRMANRTDEDGLALHSAYLHHALQSTRRAEKWKRCLALTHSAIAERQMNARIEFGWLINSRRISADMRLRDLASRAGIDEKTIRHIESASFPPNRQTIERIIAVCELKLSWNDVSPVLLEANPADGRKNRKRNSGISRIVKEKILNDFLGDSPTG